MEPQIRYAKTSDGVNIAYHAFGHGPPVVNIRVLFSHLSAEAEFGREPPWQSQASTISTIVRYDPRGFGLSDRVAPDFSLDAMCLDLEAVVADLSLRRFFLTTQGAHASQIAIAYAARHPEQVRRMALASAVVRLPPAWHEGITRIIEAFPGDWRSVTESIAQYTRNWERVDDAKASAAFARASLDMETFQTIWREFGKWDVRGSLPKVTTPTLLLYERGDPFFGPEHGRELAGAMANARLVVVEDFEVGAELPPQVRAILSFFGATPPELEAAPQAAPSGTAIILFADIAESTALTERLGDAAFREKARALDGALRRTIAEAGGTAIEGKLLGDGVLAVFTSAAQAIACAAQCHQAADAAGLRLHAGIHAGDVIREEGNVFGGAVNIASRIADASAPGEVLVSQTVRDLARTSAGVSFEDRGERELKGVSEPVRVWAVHEEKR